MEGYRGVGGSPEEENPLPTPALGHLQAAGMQHEMRGPIPRPPRKGKGVGGPRFRLHGGTPASGYGMGAPREGSLWGTLRPEAGGAGVGGEQEECPSCSPSWRNPVSMATRQEQDGHCLEEGAGPRAVPPEGDTGRDPGSPPVPGAGARGRGTPVVPRLRTWEGVRGAGRGCAPRLCETHGVRLDRGWAGGVGRTRSAPCDCSPAPQLGDGDAVRDVGRGWRQGCGIQARMRDAGRNVGQGWRQRCRMRDEGCGQGCGTGMWSTDKGCRQS